MLTDEQKKYATWAFECLDERSTGSLPCDKEMILEGARLAGLNPTEVEISHLLDGQNFGKTITKDGFLSLISCLDWKSPEESKTLLLDDFEVFTSKHPGVITAEEFLYVLTREGRERLDIDDAKEIVARFDPDQKGHINVNSLIDTLLSLTPL